MKVFVIEPIRYWVSGEATVSRLDVGETDGVLPEQLVAPEDGGADRRRALLGLGRAQPPDELLAERLRR